MEVYLSELEKMSRAERDRTLDEMVRVATAHRDDEPRLMSILRSVGGFFTHRRVSR